MIPARCWEINRKPSKRPLNWFVGWASFLETWLRWSKATDLKSADGANPSKGSNPFVSANLSPGGSANFHRGELSTQPKATRFSTRIVRLSCVDFNRRVHDGLPHLPASSKAFR